MLNLKTGAYLFLLLLLIINGVQFLKMPIENTAALVDIALEGYEASLTENGVLKLENEEALIYIKPPVAVFQGSHDPRFCWQGSGYTFSNIQRQLLSIKNKNLAIYTAKLTKKTDELYTTWWLTNGTHTTLDEWDWRWRMLRGERGFYMINITTNTPDTKIIEQVFNLSL